MMIRRVLLAALAVCCFSSYSYSEEVTGITGNAAINGNQWDMSNVLPPQAGLTVNSMRYTYKVTKEVEDSFRVHLEILNKANDSALYSQIDDWSGLPGQRILRTMPVDNLQLERMGQGQARTEGTGSIDDVNVRYGYAYDTCYNPITDPTCPGYAAAFLAYLQENGLLDQDVDPNDPYWNDVVQDILNNQTPEFKDEEEEEEVEEEEETEEPLEKMLSINSSTNKLADEVAQDAILSALAQTSKIQDYINMAQMPGGVLQDEIALPDNKISDNRNAAVRMGLANEKRHNELVDLQYD